MSRDDFTLKTKDLCTDFVQGFDSECFQPAVLRILQSIGNQSELTLKRLVVLSKLRDQVCISILLSL